MIYLDANASSAMKPAVRAAMGEAMERAGNPSSVHRQGRAARRAVDEARASVAALAGAVPGQVIFTGSGTEANALALHTASHVCASSIEHPAVLGWASDIRLPVTTDGVIDPATAAAIIAALPAGSLLSVMLVNNETGVIQPVAALAELAHRFGHRMHCDAVQAAGRLPIDFAMLGVDALTLSAHKIGGPQGVGALIVRDDYPLSPISRGGGQERNRRAGTENVAGVVGFATAACLAADDLRDMPRLAMLRDELQARLMDIAGENCVVAGAHAPRVANTLAVAMRGVGSETQVAALDLAGIATSAGAACSSGKVRTSHVWQAMGFGPGIADCGLRISLGWHSIQTDIVRCAEAWEQLYRRTHAGLPQHNRAHVAARAA